MKSGLMKKRDDDENTGEIDLTPMLDVVFILLIFFIVTSVFVTEAGIDVNKPDASTAESRSQDLILIAVSGDGQIWIDGEQIDARFIRSRFERRLAETPNASVVIQGDEAAENQHVLRILEAARDANIASVSISTEN
ncbi:MAG: biopolymer transporter ExbD [Gammaproteobacteria bacterium]|nr:biopolymer transporter ExbD [Gammaproteobacteria bacterium]|tara:strand:+ start:2049 stop:2459 length:411 start_codon:yes stop_codon:yes gene_type:complete